MTTAVVEPATNPAQAEAPAVAPATVAAPAVPATPVVTAPAEPVAIEYEATGDVGLDMALEFIGKLGIGPEHPVIQKANDGDFTALEAYLSALGDKAKGWERFVELAKISHTNNADKAAQGKQAVVSAVHAVAGSEEAWNEIKTWASANASKEEKAAINAMFDAGPVQARAAAIMLQGLYQNASGTTVTPAAAAKPGASTKVAVAENGPLTRRELVSKVEELRRRVGPNFEQSPEYASLHARLRR